MTAAFVERDRSSYGRGREYIVLRIDVEGAEYLADLLCTEAAFHNDKGADEIYQELDQAIKHWHLRNDPEKEENV